jgi:hypothetical protein
MTAWVLFGILVFLVFGVPLIDEVYRFRLRREARRGAQIVDEPISLVPDNNEQNQFGSKDVAPVVKTLEDVA